MYAALERLNEQNDRRSRGTEETTLTLDDGTSIELPTKWVVCHACDGKGTHVATSIDCGGLTSEDFDADPDFAERYYDGGYDVTCLTCHGRSTVRTVDVERLAPHIHLLYRKQLREEAAYQAECRMERMMGA